MATIDRISRMEHNFDEVSKGLKNNPESIKDGYVQKVLNELKAYYDSGQWLKDYEADERGELPKDLKRGVLSQDGLYDLLCEIDGMRK